MTISYNLGFEPIWYLVDINGTSAGGGYIVATESENLPVNKPIFQDPGGQEPYPLNAYNGISFDLNGVAPGPFYFEVDSSNPEDTYFLQAYNAQNQLLWESRNYSPSGSGGGSDVTEYIQIQNYITNNQFINHIGPTASPINSTNLVIAPSNHKGFTPSLINPIVTTYGVLGPDIIFMKDNTNATDQITFPTFTLGSNALMGDVTPVDYIRYQCTVAAAENYKNFQFPIVQKVNNLSQQTMTFSMWAAVTATPVTIDIYLRQYYGSGTASTGDVRTLVGSFTLTTTWTNNSFTFTVPNVAGNSLGSLGAQTNDDAVYIQVEMPHNSLCDVLFTKPVLYLGQVDPGIEFEAYDQIDSVNSTPRCGDIKTSLLSSAPLGWIPMNDSTIGNVGSGATYAGDYMFQLYKTIWDGVSNTWAPVSGGRGSSAVADFIANKTLTLPSSLGRALAGAGAGAGLTSRALGEYEGAETVVLTSANLPTGTAFNSGGVSNTIATLSSGGFNVNLPKNNSTPWTSGTSTSTSILQPTSFFNVFIKI